MDIFEKEKKYFFNTYKRLPIEIYNAKDCYIYDTNGKKYLDLFSGIAVNSLGYGNEKIIAAVEKQLKLFTHLSNSYVQFPQVQLAEMILSLSGFNKIFFTNSGTESMESAMKLARKWGKSFNKNKIFGMTNGFSGRTFGALSIMDKEKYKNGYEPFLPETDVIEFNSILSLTNKINSKTCAVVLEFIQGEGGVRSVTSDFIETLFDLKKKYNFLIIADEIQTGIYRTGKFFAFEYYNIKPNIVCIAKAIGGGFPLGAILGDESVANIFTTGIHGTTFGGNAISCVAGISMLEEINERKIFSNVIETGNYFIEQLKQLQNKFPKIVKEVRGIGLIIGVELNCECEDIVNKFLENQILINCTNKNVLRIVPPLILSKNQVDDAIKIFEKVFIEII